MNRSTPKALLSLAGLALFLSLSAQTSKKAAPAKKPTAVISAPVTKSAVPFLKKNGKYILVDSLSLQPLGDIEYKEFYDMSEGLRTTVNLSGKYGYIDKEGKEIIPFQFDYAGEFKGGVAKVRKNGKLGFIDLSGNEVVPAKYDDIYDFNEGLARAKKGKLSGFIDTKGNEVIPFQYTGARDFYDGLALVDIPGKRMFIDKTGKEIMSFSSSAGVNDFRGGISSAFVTMGQNWLFDKTGKKLLDKLFTYIRISKNGLAILNNKAVYNETTIDGVYGLIDNTGKEVLPMTYQYIDEIGDDIFLVMKDNSKWCVDRSGKKLFDFTYQRYQPFKEGKAAVLKNGKWGYINTTGKEIVPAKYDNLSGTFSDGLSNVQSNGLWGFIDQSGKAIIPFKYKKAYGGFKNGLARIKESDKWDDPWFYINKKGVEYREKE